MGMEEGDGGRYSGETKGAGAGEALRDLYKIARNLHSWSKEQELRGNAALSDLHSRMFSSTAALAFA